MGIYREDQGGSGEGVTLQNICIAHGDKRVVDDVSLAVGRGSVFGLIGVNGAGKSTTLSCVVGLQKPTSGGVWVAGVDVRARPEEARLKVGYVPQQLALFGGLTVQENLDIFAGLYHLGRVERRRQVAQALATAQLEDRAKDRIEHLSGGMQRRLNLVCALLHDPEVIVCDEPTVGVDPRSRAHLIDTLKGFGAAGKAVLYTAHHMDEVESLCSHVGIMDQGKLLAVGTTGEILGHRAREGCFEVELEGAADEDTLRAALRAAGLDVRAVRAATPRLEAVFMRLVANQGAPRE